ncbi:MAG: YesL family protein [Marvinbryantia sp.]|jgi:uncharacterized membrane protein YesL
MSFLRPDSEFMNAVSKCADYVILNLLCLLCCIPVITTGAALTAKYYVSMKLVRGEEPAVTKAFFKAFRKNFRQATVMWMIQMVMIAILAMDWYLVKKAPEGTIHPAFSVFLTVLTILVAGIIFCVFPMLARFYISTKDAIKGACIFTLMKLPRVLLELVATVAAGIICFWYMRWLPAIWVFCTGVMLYFNSRMFVKEFEKIEHRNGEQTQNEQEV